MSFGSIGTPVWCSTTIEREITLDGQRWTYIDDLRLLKFYEGGEGGVILKSKRATLAFQI